MEYQSFHLHPHQQCELRLNRRRQPISLGDLHPAGIGGAAGQRYNYIATCCKARKTCCQSLARQLNLLSCTLACFFATWVSRSASAILALYLLSSTHMLRFWFFSLNISILLCHTHFYNVRASSPFAQMFSTLNLHTVCGCWDTTFLRFALGVKVRLTNFLLALILEFLPHT